MSSSNQFESHYEESDTCMQVILRSNLRPNIHTYEISDTLKLPVTLTEMKKMKR